jgi:hypothetical protein
MSSAPLLRRRRPCCFRPTSSTSMSDQYASYDLTVMIYIRNLIWKMSNISTIQKPYCRQFPGLTMAAFADALKPENFTGMHFKRWQVKATLWLTTMNVFHVRPTPADSLSVSLKRAANTFSLLSVSVSVYSNTPHPTPHAVYDTWGPPAGARARRELRRGERKCGNGERRDTASILRRGMRSLLERAIVPQTVQNADAEWDRECCWSWS